jgi:nucleoid DNA-binding protein
VGLGKQEAQQIIGRFFEILKEPSPGDDVLISGFGKFFIRQKKARRGRSGAERIVVMERKEIPGIKPCKGKTIKSSLIQVRFCCP